MDTIVSKIPGRNAFLKGEKTLEIGYPWLTFGAIIFLEGIVNKNLKVLEFGSGGSTIFFAKNCKSVKSFETDKKWYESVAKKTKNFKNVQLFFGDKNFIYSSIKDEPEGFYDIVLIDPHPKDIERIEVAKSAISKVKSGGYLIVDNYLKFGMQNFRYPKGDIFTFDELKHSGKGTKICKITK